MTPGRLSALQKWILAEAAKAPDGFYHRNEIMPRRYGLDRKRAWGHYGPYLRRGDAERRKARSASVVIARSVAGLIRKGLIEERWSFMFTDDERHRYGFSYYPSEQIIMLTEAGRGKSMELGLTIRTRKNPSLNVNCGSNGTRVNNKRRAITKRK